MRILNNISIALDQLFNALCAGSADETLSARAWRQQHKRRWHVVRVVLDALFFLQPNHCEQAFMSEMTRKHLPSRYQTHLQQEES